MTILRAIDAYVPFVFLAIVLLLWGALYWILPLLWRHSAGAARWTARWLLRSRLFAFLGDRRERLESKAIFIPVVLVLVVGAVIAFVIGDQFLDLIELLRANSPAMRHVDTIAHDGATELRTPAATTFFVTVTQIGGPVGASVIALAVTIFLLVKKRYRWAIYLAITAGGGALLNLGLKEIFRRQRPDLSIALRQAHGYSFPSGHAMGSMIVFSALAYLAVRSLRDWRSRSLAVALTIAFILAVGASRIYLGVHWISDIGAGYCAGLLWFAATTSGYELFRQLAALRRQGNLPSNEETRH